MSTVLFFLAAVAISVGVTALAVVALHRPMVRWAAAGILLGLAAVAEIVLAFTARMARGAQCPPAAQTEG
jgi:hypothetical protein